MDLKFLYSLIFLISGLIIHVESLNSCEKLKKQICSTCSKKNYQCKTNKEGEIDKLYVKQWTINNSLDNKYFTDKNK